MTIKIWNLCGTVILECENGRIVCFFAAFCGLCHSNLWEESSFILPFRTFLGYNITHMIGKVYVL